MGIIKADHLLGKSKIKVNHSGYSKIEKDHFIKFEETANGYRLGSLSNPHADSELGKIQFHIREGGKKFDLDVSDLYGNLPFDLAKRVMRSEWVYAIGIGRIENSLHMVLIFGRPKNVATNQEKQLVVLFIKLEPMESPLQNGVAHGEGGDD